MIPVLFPPGATEWTTQGVGALSDAISCTATEERNGIYELEMQYPVGGIHFDEITDRSIIYAIPSPYREPQPFRVYRVTKPLNGVCTYYARHITYDLSGIPLNPFTAINAPAAMAGPQPFRVYRVTKPLNGVCTYYARHITYDLSGIPLNPFTAINAPAAMAGLQSHAALQSPFTFWTDKTTTARFSVPVPIATRSVLGGHEGSILDVYGGEYEWDAYTVKLYNHRGHDNGVRILYGKNLTDIEQDRNISNVYTGVYPYWTDADGGNMVVCNPKIIQVPGKYDFINVLP